MANTTRRQFLTCAAGACWMARPQFNFLRFGLEGASLAPIAGDPRRPQFHLLPARNWMNDPNGPIFFNGKYHMFFQYNPQAAVWGNMSWNHAVSADMIHWKNYPVAFTPTPGSADAAGCFSGSAFIVNHEGRQRVYVIYTGVVEDKAHETIRGQGLKESQCLAWSEDPMLGHWTKLPKPVIPEPPAGLKITGFRDPSIWKQGDTYFMTVGSGIEKVGGCVLLYRSSDLMQWEYLHPLISGTWNGVYTVEPVADGEMWECPEFFALDGGHVLIYSTMGKVFWQSGVLNTTTMKFEVRKTGLLDLDAYYAPKTQLDAGGRRILWGWIPERRGQAEMIEAGWSGMMSLPRVLSLDSDGALRMRILPEMSSLRAEPLAPAKRDNRFIQSIPAATGEVSCIGQKGKDLAFSVKCSDKELVSATYSAQQGAWLIDGKSIALEPSDAPAVHAFVDGSVLEIMLSERIGITKRFYYQGNVVPDISVSVQGDGVKLEAWRIAPISSNRLTSIERLE